MNPLLSDSQSKLGALLHKFQQDLLPFTPDKDCDAAFSFLAEIAEHALESQARRRESDRFHGMSVQELVKLASKEGTFVFLFLFSC